MGSSPFASAPSADTAADRVIGLRVGRNVLFLMTGQVVYCLINVAAMALLGSALGPKGYGQYAYYYALIPLFASVSDAGVGMILTREIARDRSQGPRLLGDALIVKGLISGTLLLVVLVIAWTTATREAALLISIVTATALIDPTQDPAIWRARAREQLHIEAILMVLSQVVWLPLLALGAAMKAPLAWFLGAATIAFGVRLLTGAVITLRRYGLPVFRVDRAHLARLVWEGLPFGAAIACTVLYGRVGLLVLNALATPADVGYLNVGTMLSQPFSFIANVIGIAILPMVARNAAAGDHVVRRDLLLNFKWQVLAALPLTVGLILVAQPVVGLLFKGHEFAPAAAGLQVMSLGLPVLFLNLSSRYLLTALDRQSDYLRAVLAGLVVNALLCVALIPSLGFLGACAASLGGDLTVWVVCQFALGWRVGVRDMAAVAARPLLAALGMGALVFALRGTNVIVQAALGCVSYVVLLFLLRSFSEEEMQTLRNVGVSFGVRNVGSLQRAGDRP